MYTQLLEFAQEAHRKGAWEDAVAGYEAALQLLLEDKDLAVRAEILRQIGRVHLERGDLDRASEMFESSRQAAERAGEVAKMAAALNWLGITAMKRGSHAAAAELYLSARKLADESGDDPLVAMVDLNLGILANIEGRVTAALLSYRSALERYRRFGDEGMAAAALINMGMAYVDLAEWDQAQACYDEAAELAGRSGNTLRVGLVELNRVELHLKRRRYEAARESCDRSLQIFHRLRAKPKVAEAYKYYGMLYRETAQPEQADIHFALSLGLAESCEDRLLQAETQMEWATLHLEEQRKPEGILYLNRALGIFRELKARREVLDIERRMHRLKEMYVPAVQRWGEQMAESKDPFRSGHAERVAEYAAALAREVGVTEWDLTWIQVGALLHDIGKTAVPAELLGKDGVFTDAEREVVRVHTLMGDSLAAQYHFPDEVRPIIRNHHEHWAGTGYPDRLAGEKIPFGARIVGIADVYDALTSPRSFRSAYSSDHALRIMQAEADQVFDPMLFGVFEDMLRRGAVGAGDG
jgi:putative nucleotidyltransferase with HDIG domain